MKQFDLEKKQHFFSWDGAFVLRNSPIQYIYIYIYILLWQLLLCFDIILFSDVLCSVSIGLEGILIYSKIRRGLQNANSTLMCGRCTYRTSNTRSSEWLELWRLNQVEYSECLSLKMDLCSKSKIYIFICIS